MDRSVKLNEYGELLVLNASPFPLKKLSGLYHDNLRDQISPSNHCDKCQTEIFETDWRDNNIDRAMGMELIFCSSHCINKYRKEKFCRQCYQRLPNTILYTDDIDAAIGERVRFCSSPCIKEYRIRNLCAACGIQLPTPRYYSKDINRKVGREFQFCSSNCIEKFRFLSICSQCGRLINRKYWYCRSCGEDRYRFCRYFCYLKHKFFSGHDHI